MDVIVVIDKEKLPENDRRKPTKGYEEQLKLSQDKVFEMLQKGKNITEE